MAKDIMDAVYGSLIGGAVGDAMGAPTEGMLYTEIREKYGKVTTLLPHSVSYTKGKPGNFTDDTTLRQYLCYAIAQKGGRVTPDDFAKVFIDKVNPARLWTNELIVRERIRCGINPWEAGLGWAVTLNDGADFVGRAALEAARTQVERQLVCLMALGPGIMRSGCVILHGGEQVGRVTSGGYSPTLEASIAMGYLPSSLAAASTDVEVEVRGKRLAARVVPRPFYRRPTA